MKESKKPHFFTYPVNATYSKQVVIYPFDKSAAPHPFAFGIKYIERDFHSDSISSTSASYGFNQSVQDCMHTQSPSSYCESFGNFDEKKGERERERGGVFFGMNGDEGKKYR